MLKMGLIMKSKMAAKKQQTVTFQVLLFSIINIGVVTSLSSLGSSEVKI